MFYFYVFLIDKTLISTHIYLFIYIWSVKEIFSDNHKWFYGVTTYEKIIL